MTVLLSVRRTFSFSLSSNRCIADMTTLSERAVYLAQVDAVYSCGFLIGPVIGGFLSAYSLDAAQYHPFFSASIHLDIWLPPSSCSLACLPTSPSTRLWRLPWRWTNWDTNSARPSNRTLVYPFEMATNASSHRYRPYSTKDEQSFDD